MDKQFLLSLIDKYYLNGAVEITKWNIKDKNISIDLLSTNKDLVGSITSPSFEMDDKTIAIHDTSQLLKLIGITNSFITLGIRDEGFVSTKLLIDDNEFSLEYSLAELSLVPKNPRIEEPTYDYEFDINKEIIDKFIKSKKALDNSDVSIQALNNKKGNEVEFILGTYDSNKREFTKHSNKVKFSFPLLSTITQNSDKLFVDSNYIKEIFISNKDLTKGKCYISVQGLLKLVFENELGQKSTYFLVAKN